MKTRARPTATGIRKAIAIITGLGYSAMTSMQGCAVFLELRE